MAAHDVQIQVVESVPLAVVRRQASQRELASLVPACCGLVWEAVRSQRVKAGRHVAIYWDAGIRLEVGVELHGPFTDDGEVVASATPAGTVATTTHVGPYAGLGSAHEAIACWCAANGRRLAGPSWEIYGHWQPEWDTNPAAIRTDVCWLLAD
jgi:effector-binding domain-containing protein